MNSSQIKETLKKYFSQLSNDEYDNLVKELDIVQLEAGDFLFDTGDTSDYMSFVIYGKLQALNIDETGVEHILGEIYHGETVGEMGLITEKPRNARVIALRKSLVANLNRDVFKLFYHKTPEALLNTARNVIDRLNRANALMKRVKRIEDKVICMLNPSASPEANNALEQVCAAFLNDKSGVMVNNDLTQEELCLAIYKQSVKTPFSLIKGNDKAKEQVSVSDTVVFFGQEGEFKAVKDQIDSVLVNPEHWRRLNKFLVLTYSNEEFPNIPKEWFELFEASNIFKVREGNQGDYQRVMRLISDRGIALVLSGGGAHGFAHLGVMKALKEKRIPIDFIGGTSIGSIMGAGLALDWEMEDILSKVEKDISKNNPLNDYTLPLIALLKGRRMKARLKQHFDISMENTWINFFCIGSNYQNARTEIFDKGSMYERIAASISIPGILPPSIVEGNYILDGGVLENVPVKSMRKLFRGKIITVDLSSVKNYQVKTKELPSGTSLFLRKLIPVSKKIRTPKIMNVIMKSFTLGSINERRVYEGLSDLYINPQVKKGFLQWKAFDSIVETGYKTTMELLDDKTVEAFSATRPTR